MDKTVTENISTPVESQIFGSFFLSGSEFAISVTHVQEVVNTPEKYTSFPLTPDYVIGLFNLRGTIVPVINLKSLLKLPLTDATSEQKIAILEMNGFCVGLQFDKTGEIFRSREDERSDFHGDEKKSVISGVFKKLDGQRIIQILDVHALFDLEKVPKETRDGRTVGRHGLRNRKGARQQCISFLVGPAKCGLGISEIQEILKVDQLNNSALGTGYCIGVIDLRGATVPVIDFAALLTYRDCDSSQDATKGDRRIVVLRMGDELFGLLVDSVESIVSYYKEDLKTFPALQSSRREMFKGCISIEEKEDILLMDHTNILSNEEVQQITHGHSKIYQAANNNQKIANASAAGARRTFITFKVDQLFAIGISEVKEIIECPEKLLQPPGLPTYCRGVLNLRGDLVPIVDAQTMYGLEAKSEKKSTKALIFKSEDAHFGLVVDSVEAIISVNNESKVRLPEMLYAEGGGMAEDVVEAIQSKDTEGRDQNLLILNSSSIAKRINAAG